MALSNRQPGESSPLITEQQRKLAIAKLAEELRQEQIAEEKKIAEEKLAAEKRQAEELEKIQINKPENIQLIKDSQIIFKSLYSKELAECKENIDASNDEKLFNITVLEKLNADLTKLIEPEYYENISAGLINAEKNILLTINDLYQEVNPENINQLMDNIAALNEQQKISGQVSCLSPLAQLILAGVFYYAVVLSVLAASIYGLKRTENNNSAIVMAPIFGTSISGTFLIVPILGFLSPENNGARINYSQSNTDWRINSNNKNTSEKLISTLNFIAQRGQKIIAQQKLALPAEAHDDLENNAAGKTMTNKFG